MPEIITPKTPKPTNPNKNKDKKNEILNPKISVGINQAHNIIGKTRDGKIKNPNGKV